MTDYQGLTLGKFSFVRGRHYQGYYGEVNYEGKPIAVIEDDGHLCYTDVSFYDKSYKEIWEKAKEHLKKEINHPHERLGDFRLIERLIQIHLENTTDKIPTVGQKSSI